MTTERLDLFPADFGTTTTPGDLDSQYATGTTAAALHKFACGGEYTLFVTGDDIYLRLSGGDTATAATNADIPLPKGAFYKFTPRRMRTDHASILGQAGTWKVWVWKSSTISGG